MKMKQARATIFGVFLFVFLQGCSSLGSLFGPSEDELSGENAFLYFEQDTSLAPKQNLSATLDAISLQPGDVVKDPAVIEVLRSSARARQNIQPQSFKLLASPELSAYSESYYEDIDTSQLADRYVIPRLEDLPVRNQGARGTCAAFAGVGHLEYAALKHYPSLATLDLAEQRFYYNAKPECQETGCSLMEEGSSYEAGLDASLNALSFDIPLERDCPYSAQPGSNDLQIPQVAGCSKGAAKVESIEWVSQTQEIVDALEQEGLPVLFASPLSDNFFWNDGLITAAAAGDARGAEHSAGHAYLIVGYERLPDMPEEGGMCFIIKNSWGTGWGINGYACATLRWMQNWSYGYVFPQPQVQSLALSSEALQASGGSEDDPQPLPPSYDPETYDGDDEITTEFIPAPVEAEALSWRDVNLLGPDGIYYHARFATEDGKAFLRAALHGYAYSSSTLELELYDGALRSNGIAVGQIANEEVQLCSGGYDLLCGLRFAPQENRLYVEMRGFDWAEVSESELTAGRWLEMPLPSGGSLAVLEPELGVQGLSWIHARYQSPGGEPSDAIRLGVNGMRLEVLGQPIGSLAPGEQGLCTGPWASACTIGLVDNELTLLPRVGH